MTLKSTTGLKRGRGRIKPVLRSEIEEAQRHTNSNMAASKYLGIPYDRYKRYAKLYDLFDSHANPTGIGTDKGLAKRPNSVSLKDILEGKHPKYSPAKLKNRLIARRKIEEKCEICGFNEKRITDNKSPLMLNFIDGNRLNFSLDNLNLLCYNCMFLTTGAPTVVYRNKIEKSLANPEKAPKKHDLAITPRDYLDEEDLELWSVELTEEEKNELMNLTLE
jgi:hypothetical protein